MSTETALLRVFNDLLTASDSGSISILTHLDLSAAFDTIDHSILLTLLDLSAAFDTIDHSILLTLLDLSAAFDTIDHSILLTLLDLSAAFDTIDHSILRTRVENAFGVCDFDLSFFWGRTQVGRTQVVTVNEVKSSPSLLTCGVRQGSVLEPILFILYTQPLSYVIGRYSVSHHMFAYDTGLYKSDSPSEAFTLAQNKLQLNDDKTEIILIGSAPGTDLPSSLCVGPSDIPFSSADRNLGVIFDNQLALK